jgi:hypothetical protein
VAAAALALLAVTTGACSGDDDAPDGPEASGLTRPGSTLDLGQTATITRDSAAEELGVTISSIDAGTSADLSAVPSSTGGTPWFVRYELTHGSGPSPYLPIDSLFTGYAGDDQLTLLSPVEPVPSCVSQTFGDDAPVGTTVSGCATFVAGPGAAPLDRVVLSYGDDYDAFDDHAITWEQPD